MHASVNTTCCSSDPTSPTSGQMTTVGVLQNLKVNSTWNEKMIFFYCEHVICGKEFTTALIFNKKHLFYYGVAKWAQCKNFYMAAMWNQFKLRMYYDFYSAFEWNN